jgi:hypothetical protein
VAANAESSRAPCNDKAVNTVPAVEACAIRSGPQRAVYLSESGTKRSGILVVANALSVAAFAADIVACRTPQRGCSPKADNVYRNIMHPDFDLPSKGRVDGRTSSITAAFFQAITPVVPPSDGEVDKALAVLGMAKGSCRCAYCGDVHTEWDHFRPIVKGRQPTGYITEIANLVPACGKCNQSKGNKNWKEWMLSAAARSPKQRGISDLAERMARLEAYDRWREPICIDYAALVGPERWSQYQDLLNTAVTHLAEAQKVALELQAIIRAALAPRDESGAVSKVGGC